MIPRDRQNGEAEAPEELGGRLELRTAAAVGQIAGRDEHLGLQVGDQLTERAKRLPCLSVTHVQVGEVENAAVTAERGYPRSASAIVASSVSLDSKRGQ